MAQVEVKTVEVVRAEGRGENTAHLIEIASDFQFLRGAPDGEVVDEYLRLIQSAPADPGNLPELQVSQVLHADPDADAQHRHYEAQGTSGGPEQEETEHGEDGGDPVENDHDLAVRHSVLQELVMDVLAIGSENRTATDQAAKYGEHGLENRQAEGDDGNGNRDDGRSFLRPIKGKR